MIIPRCLMRKDGVIYVLCGQGADGDYDGGDSLHLARYRSEDLDTASSSIRWWMERRRGDSEISEQGLDSRKETVLQSEPMKQTTEKSSVVITKKTEMGKSKTETEPTESGRLMRGAGNDSRIHPGVLHQNGCYGVGCSGACDRYQAGYRFESVSEAYSEPYFTRQAV